jgi:hypothetical protein
MDISPANCHPSHITYTTKKENPRGYGYHPDHSQRPNLLKSDKFNVIRAKESGNYDSESPITWANSKSSHIKDHKVLIIGNSHIRNCAANVKSNVKDNFEIQGVVKPGARTNILVNSVNN